MTIRTNDSSGSEGTFLVTKTEELRCGKNAAVAGGQGLPNIVRPAVVKRAAEGVTASFLNVLGEQSFGRKLIADIRRFL